MATKIRKHKTISENLNVSASEAESSDDKLEDAKLKPFRTDILKRKYESQANKKNNNEMKQYSIQQKGFTERLFNGTSVSIESVMI